MKFIEDELILIRAMAQKAGEEIDRTMEKDLKEALGIDDTLPGPPTGQATKESLKKLTKDKLIERIMKLEAMVFMAQQETESARRKEEVEKKKAERHNRAHECTVQRNADDALREQGYQKGMSQAIRVMLGELRPRPETPMMTASMADERPINVIFDGPPGPTAGRFIDVETDDGSINAGEWSQRSDGHWALRIESLRGLDKRV